MTPSIDIVVLQTLPGWPDAPTESAWTYWLLLLLLPLAVTVAAIVFATIRVALGRRGPKGELHETQWLGAVGRDDRSALSLARPVAELAPRNHGGASARW